MLGHPNRTRLLALSFLVAYDRLVLVDVDGSTRPPQTTYVLVLVENYGASGGGTVIPVYVLDVTGLEDIFVVVVDDHGKSVTGLVVMIAVDHRLRMQHVS